MEQAKVLLIYTGGTIGMVENHNTGALSAFDFEHLNVQVPELSRINAELTVISMEKAIDSSDMNPSLWKTLAHTIYEHYNDFDGFVILHGTDTMAYTASALSYMLQGLQKPVILTGSQLPVGMIRTDGKENLITSIEIAAYKENGISLIQEVVIYFEDHLFRGNRTVKVSANNFDAFLSPNYLPLADAGIRITYNKAALYSTAYNRLIIKDKMDERVALLKIFPGFSIAIYAGLFDIIKVKAIVIETFGSGNVPNDEKLLQTIHNYVKSGGIVINITQCYSGFVVQGKYENSAILDKVGVISGLDMTTEAAITKIMHLLANYNDSESIKKLMVTSIAGEVTE